MPADTALEQLDYGLLVPLEGPVDTEGQLVVVGRIAGSLVRVGLGQ